MKKIVLNLLLMIVLGLTVFTPMKVDATYVSASVGYESYIENSGWQTMKYDGDLSGVIESSDVSGFRLFLMDGVADAGISYRAYVQNLGWSNWQSNGSILGNENIASKFTGLQIKLTSFPNSDVHYQVHLKGKGWSSWKKNGVTAGNLTNQIDAIRVKVVEIGVSYRSYVSGIGWNLTRANGETSGNDGKAKNLESVSIKLQHLPIGAKIEYRVHVQDLGWTVWAENGSYTTNTKNKIEAIQIRLLGLQGYSIAYQAEVSGQGWQDWVYDGATAGTTGQNLRLDAYRIKVVKVKEEPVVAILPTPIVDPIPEPTPEPDPEPNTDPATFNFDDQSGSACFYATLAPGESVSIGIIPSGVTNVYIELQSEVDVDLELYNVGTPESIIVYDDLDSFFNVDDGYPVEGAYSDLYIYYSGWYGDALFDDNDEWISGSQGNETIEIVGTLSEGFEIKAYNWDETNVTTIQVCYDYGYDIPQ